MVTIDEIRKAVEEKIKEEFGAKLNEGLSFNDAYYELEDDLYDVIAQALPTNHDTIVSLLISDDLSTPAIQFEGSVLADIVIDALTIRLYRHITLPDILQFMPDDFEDLVPEE